MGVTEQVLALHRGISEAFILEEKAGHLQIIEETAKGSVATLSDIIGEMTESSALAPALILGAAAQLSKTPGSMRLVGILYGETGIILAYFGENRVLAASTESSSLGDAMQMVNDALPDLIKKSQMVTKTLNAVKSAVEAGEIARDYVTSISKSPRISINEISYHAGKEKWEVRGTYRTVLLAPSKHFELEIDEAEGAIVTFRSSSSSGLFGLWLVALLAALGLVAWMLYGLLTR